MCYCIPMQCVVHSTAAANFQQLATEWHGEQIRPPFNFLFYIEGEHLTFSINRQAPAIIHPQAKPGLFQENLWRYDVTEFFIATADARQYLEFNLCPNGAWWAEGFTDPRVKLAGFDARKLHPVISTNFTADAWQASARLPLNFLQEWGWQIHSCRLATAAVICRNGLYTYLTTCEQRAGKPDFHHPRDWEMVQTPQ